MDFERVQENLRPAFNMTRKPLKWSRAICCTGNFQPCIIYWILRVCYLYYFHSFNSFTIKSCSLWAFISLMNHVESNNHCQAFFLSFICLQCSFDNIEGFIFIFSFLELVLEIWNVSELFIFYVKCVHMKYIFYVKCVHMKYNDRNLALGLWNEKKQEKVRGKLRGRMEMVAVWVRWMNGGTGGKDRWWNLDAAASSLGKGFLRFHYHFIDFWKLAGWWVVVDDVQSKKSVKLRQYYSNTRQDKIQNKNLKCI